MPTARIETLARPSWAWLVRVFAAIRSFLRTIKVRRRARSLRICETLPLGDKRLLAVIQIEGRRLLIGATNHSVSLLDRLDSPAPPRPKSELSSENTYLSGVH